MKDILRILKEKSPESDRTLRELLFPDHELSVDSINYITERLNEKNQEKNVEYIKTITNIDDLDKLDFKNGKTKKIPFCLSGHYYYVEIQHNYMDKNVKILIANPTGEENLESNGSNGNKIRDKLKSLLKLEDDKKFKPAGIKQQRKVGENFNKACGFYVLGYLLGYEAEENQDELPLKLEVYSRLSYRLIDFELAGIVGGYKEENTPCQLKNSNDKDFVIGKLKQYKKEKNNKDWIDKFFVAVSEAIQQIQKDEQLAIKLARQLLAKKRNKFNITKEEATQQQRKELIHWEKEKRIAEIQKQIEEKERAARCQQPLPTLQRNPSGCGSEANRVYPSPRYGMGAVVPVGVC